MTAELFPEFAVAGQPLRTREYSPLLRRSLHWIATRWLECVAVLPVVTATGIVQAIGITGWPPPNNDDEGTYMAEAWAVQTGQGAHHGLAPYTYWYDHPPLGWIQLAGIGWFTHTYRPGNMVVASGREIMLGYALASALLVYVLARRVGCGRWWAAAATALFGLSPLSVDYLRLVFLDCIGLPWILAAFVLLLSPSKRVWTHAVAGACFAIGVLSKETYLLIAPAVVWQAWQGAELRTRRMAMTLFSAVFLVVASYYPLYAALKGELFPGNGHVSLLGSALWQVDQRAGSGSVFSASSGSHDQVMSWLHSDPWLVGVALLAMPFAFVVRRLRPVALGYAIFAAALLRRGYLPDAFVVGALPLAALVIAGVGQAGTATVLRLLSASRSGGRRAGTFAAAISLALMLFASTGYLALRVVPEWSHADRLRMTAYAVYLTPVAQAEDWVDQHVAKSATLLVDDDVWTDLVDDGFEPSRVVWAYKLDLDPAVAHMYPGGWRDMDYVVLTKALHSDIFDDPVGTADPRAAVEHGYVIASFGSGPTQVTVLKVNHPADDRQSDRIHIQPSNLQ